MRRSNQHSRLLTPAIQCGVKVFSLMLILAVPEVAWAQTDVAKKPTQEAEQSKAVSPLRPILNTPEKDTATEPKILDSETQAKLVREIYDATKSASNAKDYTALVEKCAKVGEFALDRRNRDYVLSIKGWALNRRAESRLEVAQQFKAIGSIEQFQKALDAAMDDFDSSLINAPERHRSWNSRGQANILKQDWQAAIKDFTEATQRKPDFAAAWFNRAEANFAAGQFEAALADYETLLRMSHEDVEAINGRGLCLVKLSKYEQAIKDFDNVIKLLPTRGLARINRGDAHLAAGQWQAASDDYLAAQAIESDEKIADEKRKSDLVAKQRIAWLLATCPDESIRDPKKSLSIMETMIEAEGETQVRLETLAAAQAANGAFDKARQSQENAIRLVGFEELEGDNPSKVRLLLYEQNRPYLQK